MGFDLRDDRVRGDLFTETGKWKYTVTLDYNYEGFDYNHWDIHTAAEKAFANGEGVRMDTIPTGWTLVVLEPYALNGFPISVKGA